MTTLKSYNSNKDLAIKTSIISIVLNIVLLILKFIAGIVSHSSAMISDAVHSASDVLSTVVVIVGVNIASKKPDKEHPYGHERFESISAMFLAVLLATTGLIIGYNGIKNIFTNSYTQITGNLAIISALISIAVKEWQYQYTKRVAKKINSDSLMADAWHHRSDALSSIGSFIGVLGAMLGLPVMDSVASIVISIMIVHVGYTILKEAIDKLIDKSCDDNTNKQIEDFINAQQGVRGLSEFRSRLFGNKVYVDVTILVDGTLLLKDAHTICEAVHDNVEKNFPDIKHCMIHVHPYNK